MSRKGSRKRPKQDPSHLEVVLRIRRPRGYIVSEWTIRGDRVELVNFWPDGTVELHTVVTLDRFAEELKKAEAP